VETPCPGCAGFISRRQNLLSPMSRTNLRHIKDEISTGLNPGESIADLSKRITRPLTR
jgi:hypothetical protein